MKNEPDNNLNWFCSIICAYNNIEMIRLLALQPFCVSNITFEPDVRSKGLMLSYPVSHFGFFEFYLSEVEGLPCPFRAIRQSRGVSKALGTEEAPKLLTSSIIQYVEQLREPELLDGNDDSPSPFQSCHTF